MIVAMLRTPTALLVLGSLLLLPTLALAQRKMPVGLEPPQARFEKAPELGETFPDITIVDDEGKPVNIRELAGRKPYTVLTIGCLT